MIKDDRGGQRVRRAIVGKGLLGDRFNPTSVSSSCCLQQITSVSSDHEIFAHVNLALSLF
jgi:hypothetical protein